MRRLCDSVLMSNDGEIRTSLDAFPGDVPSRAILSAALEGRSRSRLVVDPSDSDPMSSGAILCRIENGTVFVGRGVSQRFFESALSALRREQRLVLTMTRRQESAYDWRWVGDRPVFERFEHADLDLDAVARWSDQLLESRTIVRIDRDLFRRCAWHDFMSSMLGHEDRFLADALGICQMDGASIVTEAYAIVSDSAGAEIGAITHEPYRRAGNAVVTCSRLIKQYLCDGAPVYWCCDQGNDASARTANRLGFRSRREYRFVIVPQADGPFQR